MADRPSITLSEAMARYLATLKKEDQQEAQQEVSRFVQWCGRDRRVVGLTPPEVGDYVEGYVGAANLEAKRLVPVRRFLSYLHKSGLTATNLSTHLKVSRGKKQVRRAGRGRAVRKSYLTPEGYAQAQSELLSLREERLKVVEDIQRAMADKDFRENAPLDAAKERQGMIETRIRELEEVLAQAIVEEKAQPQSSSVRVNRSSRVTLSDIASGRETLYMLVDPREANPASGKLSFSSPIGKALLGRSVGEEVSITVPRGTLRFRIVKVER